MPKRESSGYSNILLKCISRVNKIRPVLIEYARMFPLLASANPTFRAVYKLYPQSIIASSVALYIQASLNSFMTLPIQKQNALPLPQL
jgi:hypothetical protein